MTTEIQTRIFSVEIDIDPADGKIHEERWRDETGSYNRLGDLPAFIRYCPDTGLPDYRRWHNSQGGHRENDMPSTVSTNTKTGIDTGLLYSVNGVIHRDGDKPAMIMRHSRGQLKEEHFWNNGQIHRDPRLGPAIIYYNPKTGGAVNSEYWVNGTRIEDPTLTSTLDI